MKNTSKSNTQQNANETNNSNFGIDTKKNKKNTELIKRTNIENTPFTIIEVNKKYFGTMGMNRITEEHDTFEEAKKETTEITWNRIIQTISIIIEHEKKINNLLNETK